MTASVQQNNSPIRIEIPPFYRFLAEPHRYKSVHGGRGAARSWSFARTLTGLAVARKKRILCTREFQSSIKDSVHQLLSDQIATLGLSRYYDIRRDYIRSTVGSEFIFKGLKTNTTEIKSIEGIDICWVEEAQTTSDDSWGILIPTIRKDNSEIWLSWNTGEETDPTYKRFVANPPDDCVSVKATYLNNPFFPETLERERLYLQRVDPDAYAHIWEGDPKHIGDACIFKGKYAIEEFEAPEGTRFYYGSDWGFSTDPTTLIRSYIVGNHLYIDYEAYGVGVELDEIPQLFSVVPGYREWPILADNSRPETISYLRKQHGLRTEAAEKGKGSVEDGISYLRKFEKIHVHQRCKHTIEELKLYSYKQDPQTKEVLPIIIDKHNHCIDAIRYGLQKKIKGGYSWADVCGD